MIINLLKLDRLPNIMEDDDHGSILGGNMMISATELPQMIGRVYRYLSSMLASTTMEQIIITTAMNPIMYMIITKQRMNGKLNIYFSLNSSILLELIVRKVLRKETMLYPRIMNGTKQDPHSILEFLDSEWDRTLCHRTLAIPKIGYTLWWMYGD